MPLGVLLVKVLYKLRYFFFFFFWWISDRICHFSAFGALIHISFLYPATQQWYSQHNRGRILWFRIRCQSICPAGHLYFCFWMITWVNVNGFSPNLVCALILWRSCFGLLMGKFCHFLTDLSARHTFMFSFLEDGWIKMNWFSPNLVWALILWRSAFGLLMGKFCLFWMELSAHHTIAARYYHDTFLLYPASGVCPFLSYAPLKKIAMKSCKQDISKTIWTVIVKLNMLIWDDKLMTWLTFGKNLKIFSWTMALWKFRHWNCVGKLAWKLLMILRWNLTGW